MHPLPRSLLLVIVASLLACGSRNKQASTTPAVEGPTASAAPATSDEAGDDAEAPSGPFATIYFEYDASELDAQARETLGRLAETLAQAPGRNVRVEGHADERGTPEYNVSLGSKRAEVIKAYLTRLGVDAPRIWVISYGEERPAVVGSSEAAWAKNRRAELVLLGPGER